MSGFEKSTENFDQGTLKNEQIEELRKLFQIALADGRLSTKEIAQIQFFYYESELSAEDFAVVKNNVFQAIVESALADQIVTEQEEASIFRIAKQLGIAPESATWRRGKIQLNES